jgi:hypothetical protein
VGGDDVIDGEQLPLPPLQDRGFDNWYESAPASPNLGGWPTTPKEPAEPEVLTASKHAIQHLIFALGQRQTKQIQVYIVCFAVLQQRTASEQIIRMHVRLLAGSVLLL